ncbi:Gag-Pol polyprotein [Plecturocebus cupreus]
MPEIEQRTFDKLKTALTVAPALALPNISKPFRLFVPKGVLTQTSGPWSRPVTYLSKRLDPVASGWPACLRSVAATALLVKEADKLTLGQELNLVAPHVVESLLRGAPGKWMSNARIVQYQALLLDQPRIKFLKTAVLKPATLLPDSDPEEPIHDCQQTVDVLHAARPDLTDVPLQNPEEVLYTDGSNFMINGVRPADDASTHAETFSSQSCPGEELL